MYILAACVFCVAVVFTMLGQGGGTLYTPLQVFFGIEFHVAAATSLFLIIVASLSSTLVFRKKGRVDWPLALALESVTALGGFVGGYTSGGYSAAFLSYVFAGLVGFAAIFMILEFHGEHRCATPSSRVTCWHRRHGGLEYSVNLAVALPVSFCAGLVSGLVGVGGGILKVPMMVLLFGVPMEIAVGSSAFMVGVTAVGGLMGHLASGRWDWRTALVLGVAVFLGGQIGARWSLSLDKKKLKKGFGWFLLVVAAAMVARALVH